MNALAWGVLFLAWAQAESIHSVDEILTALDHNMTFDTRTASITMTVVKGKRTKTYDMKSHARGPHEAAIQFSAPPRDKDTRMLKGKNELWIYMPTIEKTQKISGHMLRQGMMGSDFSYEDMMQATALAALYDAVVTGEEEVNGRPCYRMELTAKSNETTYPKRISWVDREKNVPVKEELYALSGMLLKVWTMSEVVWIDGHHFPTRIVVEDKIKANSITTLTFRDVSFHVQLEDEVFSRRWLER